MNTTNPTPASTPQSAPVKPRRGLDPILREVYELKARLNKEAGYSVDKILERVRESAKLAQK